jgi:hypothetical protein
MQDLYSPVSSYSFALHYVQICTNPPWCQAQQQLPVSLAEMFTYISEYLCHQDYMRYQKISFHQYLFRKMEIRRHVPMIATEPKVGLIEFRLVRWPMPPKLPPNHTGPMPSSLMLSESMSLMFPAELNSGWQSTEFKAHMVQGTMFHGYVVERAEAVKLFEVMRELDSRQTRHPA